MTHARAFLLIFSFWLLLSLIASRALSPEKEQKETRRRADHVVVSSNYVTWLFYLFSVEIENLIFGMNDALVVFPRINADVTQLCVSRM